MKSASRFDFVCPEHAGSVASSVASTRDLWPFCAAFPCTLHQNLNLPLAVLSACCRPHCLTAEKDPPGVDPNQCTGSNTGVNDSLLITDGAGMSNGAMFALILGAILLGAIGLELGPIAVGCGIKGNISASTGERIYHMPGQRYYFATRINWWSRDERWFCSEADARAAGWRKARV
jgi:hypothetical protein